MPYRGFVVNSKHSDPWILAIGKFIINFGAIEMLSFVWIDRLSKDSLLQELTLDMQLSKRIELIRKMIQRNNLPKNLDRDVRNAWTTAESLSRLRNDIAHSPIVLGWHGNEEERPPDYIGSFNIKKLKGKISGKQPQIVPLIELKKLNRSIDDIVKVAQNLDTLLEKVVNELKNRQPGNK